MDDETRPPEPEVSGDFLDRWKTDVAPVHDRTERSREFRTGFFHLALRSLLLLNGVALVAFPAVGRLVGASFADNLSAFLLAEGAFFVGVVLAVTATLLCLVMLDVDVVRQKGERAEARRRLMVGPHAGRAPDSAEADGVRSELHQARYWRIGVGLMWTVVPLLVLAIAAFVAGGLLARRVLATASF